jgi:sialate O-acetylesterase
MKKRIVVLIFCAMLICGIAQADVTVPTMFSDHAVLQRGMSVPVWGTASPGEQVTVEFGGQTKTTNASSSGVWMIYLNEMDASTAPSDIVITGDNVITITDVQVGEVWVGSGQSNMFNPLSGDCDADSAIAGSGSYNIRFFNVGSGVPDGTVWEVSGPETSPSFSAVHFYFGRHLAENLLGVPIGLIHSAVSATAIERWATCAGSGGLYRDQIKPLQPYAIRGVTWYQGEWDSRNANDAEKYYWQLPCLINEWRTDWGQTPLDFPFYIVQMPKMGLGSIHIVRDAELQAAIDDSKVEMIVTIDNPGSDVHPPCKDLYFGFRLTKLARKFEYDHSIDARSPFYNATASYVAGDTIGVVFDNVAGGLQSSGGPDDSLAEWEIAGSNGSYVTADAVIVNTDTVEVSSPDVPSPVSARYAFSKNPEANNLINSAGLPASPIREVTPGNGGPVCGDDSCDPGEDPCNCASDCGVPPLEEINCTDDIDEDCDDYTDCDDSDCDSDLACPDCLPKGVACTDNAECCSSRCLPAGKCAK